MLDKITGCSTAEKSNQAILDLAIALRGSDQNLMEFCSIMETVIVDKQKVATVVEPLRNGLYCAMPYTHQYHACTHQN